MADPAGLDIAADLTGDLDGKQFQIRSDGDRTIICDFADLNTLLVLRRVARTHLKLRQLGRYLELLEYAVEIRIGGTSVVRLGNLVSSRFWRLLGFPATKVSLTRIASLLLTRRA